VFKQGKEWKGWEVTFLQNFAEANTLLFEPIEQPTFDNIWLLPGQGVCDIAATGISDTADRRNATNIPGKVGCWSAAYYGVLRTFLVRTGDYARLEDVRDLAGKTAIVTKGSTANTDLCYRMRLANLHPCTKEDSDHPCNFKGLQGFKETTREDDGSCVDIQYPRNNDEKNSACAIANNEQYKKNAACTIANDEDNTPFTYGGGYGSIRTLVDTPDQSLTAVWPHCNMGSDFQAYSEPFSFVVRAESTGLLKALNNYIAMTQSPSPAYQPYEGTPIPDLGCEAPPWTKDHQQPDVCTQK